MTQPEFAALGGVQKRAQINYEAGERFPDVEYLSKIAEAGVDVRLLVTGDSEYDPPPPLSKPELDLVSAYRTAPPIGKLFINWVVDRGNTASDESASESDRPNVVVHGNVGQQVRGTAHVGTIKVGGSTPPKRAK